ncbi:hypothetical protein CYY_007396 [Polysphondylium violaceum]|uniref:UBX domain-containing protein n=1 Tax=Polysphondylium violaceum TaxID=133409 RepID=A0A8J4PPQ4_9MYCE|nr:hypothetical protein CYY_007396 [Polysphondylium violaceum]
MQLNNNNCSYSINSTSITLRKLDSFEEIISRDDSFYKLKFQCSYSNCRANDEITCDLCNNKHCINHSQPSLHKCPFDYKNTTVEIKIIQTNGKSIKNIFQENELLENVQEFINRNRTDCSNRPYTVVLANNSTNITFTRDDLKKTLAQLNFNLSNNKITLKMIPLRKKSSQNLIIKRNNNIINNNIKKQFTNYFSKIFK